MLHHSLLLPLALLAPPADPLPAPITAAAAGGRVDALRANLKFLASDLLEGRGTGDRGGDLAAAYLAAQLEELGAEPGGADGSYFQEVPLLGVETDWAASTAAIQCGERAFPLAWKDDFVGLDESLADASAIDAEIVFVGYGIASPEQAWDDYKGTDVRGKVLLMLVNDPPSEDPKVFGGKALTYAGRWTYKYEEAHRRGAAAAILVHRDDMAGYGWNVVASSNGREKPYVGERAAPGAPAAGLRLASWIREDRARTVLAAAGQDLDRLLAAAARRDFQPVDLGCRLVANVRSRLRPLATRNVLGVVRGRTEPASAVVYTAHYDHLGMREVPAGQDGIYNGAVDNASGCAAVLEIARMFRSLEPRPARSILFLFVTAEEGGLRGSEYYARHPTFAPAAIAANINLDGLPVEGTPLEFEPLGYERSTLRAPLELVAGALGVALAPDSKPEQGVFYRSDHFNFAKIGVPAISLGAGLAFAGQPDGFGQSLRDDYRAHRYHQPSDEYEERWDLAGTLATARFAFACGALVAEDPELPNYLPGDEFARSR